MKKLVILIAAMGIMTACNDKNNKKAKAAPAAPISEQGAPEATPEKAVEESVEDTTAADAELAKFIQASDWCRDINKGGSFVSVIAMGEGSQMAVQKYKRSKDSDKMTFEKVMRGKVVKGQLVLTSESNEKGAMETKTTVMDVTTRADEITDELTLKVSGDELGTETTYERCRVARDFNVQ